MRNSVRINNLQIKISDEHIIAWLREEIGLAAEQGGRIFSAMAERFDAQA
ncbi:MAG: hypothetical protein KAH23_09420 [Kiritimatiellae bacterium]|nr:hypothetical protein [Kiritimatiellia bacterium]